MLDKGEIQQYDTPSEVLKNPKTDFVKRLVERERRTCSLEYDKLGECKFSGVEVTKGLLKIKDKM